MIEGIVIGVIASVVTFILFHIAKFIMNRKNQFSNIDLIRLIEHSKDIFYYYQIQPTKKHIFISKSVDQILGKGTHKLLFQHPDYVSKIIHPEDEEILGHKVFGKLDYNKRIILRFRAQNGEYKWLEEYATPIYKNGHLVALHGIYRSIDETINLQQQLERDLTYDSMTEVYNRRYFEAKMMEYNTQLDFTVGMIICDLDDLKYVNDNFGHQQGDLYIISIAKLLQAVFGDRAIVTRIGGDEFAILLEFVEKDDLSFFEQKIAEAVEDYNFDATGGKKLRVSVGSAWTASSLGNTDQLYMQADNAMYENKREKKKYLCEA